MAKGNLFLGTAAKSVGDVVMYRREGAQVSRVRVRKIANPKTDAQCKQRAIMSAVVKFYQPLADTLERSWQGMSTAKSYAKFLKANATIGRTGEYYLPKGSGLLPFPYKLSNGTLAPISCVADGAIGTFNLPAPLDDAATITSVGGLSSFFIQMGAKAGDVVTIITIGKKLNGPYLPYVAQFEVDTTSKVTLSSIMPAFKFNDAEQGDSVITFQLNGADIAGAACIVSQFKNNEWLRSNAELSVDSDVLDELTSAAAKAAAIESYKGTAASDNPLVYLDGDELQ